MVGTTEALNANCESVQIPDRYINIMHPKLFYANIMIWNSM